MLPIADLLREARTRVKQLTHNLPGVVDPAAVSLKAKIPFKVVLYRETLIWRTEEFARCACDLYQRDDIGSAIVLTRAVTENAAAAWYLMQLIEDTNRLSHVADLDDRVMRLLMGSRSIGGLPHALNVKSMLAKAEKSIPGISSNYDSLSEFAHPNWSGTSGLYSKINRDEVVAHLGKHLRSTKAPLELGLNSLIGALVMFEHAYNSITDHMPNFISTCEAVLGDRE